VKASDGVEVFCAVRPLGNTSVSRTGTPTASTASAVTPLVTATGRAIEVPDSGTCTIALPSSSFITVSVPLYAW
jgi:hypothetical protein